MSITRKVNQFVRDGSVGARYDNYPVHFPEGGLVILVFCSTFTSLAGGNPYRNRGWATLAEWAPNRTIRVLAHAKREWIGESHGSQTLSYTVNKLLAEIESCNADYPNDKIRVVLMDENGNDIGEPGSTEHRKWKRNRIERLGLRKPKSETQLRREALRSTERLRKKSKVYAFDEEVGF